MLGPGWNRVAGVRAGMLGLRARVGVDGVVGDSVSICTSVALCEQLAAAWALLWEALVVASIAIRSDFDFGPL